MKEGFIEFLFKIDQFSYRNLFCQMNVKERIQQLERQKKEREEAEQLNKMSKSTQINYGQQGSNLMQNQQEQQEQNQTTRENDVIQTLNQMLHENPEVRQKIEGQLQKQIERQAQQEEESDEEIEKNDQLSVKEIIQKVNHKELQSEDRIYVGMITNELTTEIKRSQRQSMDYQQISLQDRSQSILKSKLIIDYKSQLIFVRDDDYYLEQIDKILFIQRFIKQKLEKDRKERIENELQLKQKMNRYRINVLNELVQSEDKYVSDLKILNTVKNLLVEKFPQKEDEIKMMFNIHEILKFNTEFLSEFQKQNDLKDPNAIVMQNIVPLLNGFIFYYEYCKAYDQARKLCSQFEIQPGFIQFMKDITKLNLLKGLSLNDYTIKPVQRLPKYVLLFKDLLKHTLPSHPDYQNVKYCLETIEKINDKNNDEMNVYLKQAKLIELHQQFENIQNLQILKPNMCFIFEDICSIFTKKIEQRIIIYAFNNLLLFAKQGKQNVLKYKLHIPITYQSYLKDLKDLVILKNSFEVVSRNETIVIVNEDSDSKQQFMMKIQNIINQQVELFQSKNDKKQENNICIKVEIQGTEIDQKLNKKVTFYQTIFTVESIIVKTQIRFSQMKNLLQIINKYDNKLKIPNLTKTLSSKKEKIIDERKLKIEQLLQMVLNSPKIFENIEYQQQVLEILYLDPRLYNFPELKRQNPEMFQNMLELRQSQNQKNSSLELLQQLQQQTYSSNINKDDQLIKIGNEAQLQPYYIEITLLTEQTLQVGFQKNTRTWFIKKAIANYINLNYFVDFKIFIVDTGGIIRVVDDEEKISTLLDKSKQGFFQALKKIFHNGTKFQFIFRKYLYLPWKQEEIQYQQDQIRSKYLMFEIVFQARNGENPFNFLDFCLIIAYYIIATQQKIDKNLLKKAIPSSIIKQHSEKLWLEQIQRQVAQIEKKIAEFSNQSKQMQQNKKNLSLQNLSNLFIKSCFEDNFFFGMQLFFVECPKEVIQMVQQGNFGFKLQAHIFIGLNYNGLHFIDSKSRNQLGRMEYDQITEIKSFPIELTCKIKNQNFKFKTQTPFEIKHLILEYQEIIKILNS
ncbi:unnamed protein product [Paramecium sonneborni]|uniref:DH domain-containing protein n=1 Tax=Paramecium sonneborni TaxID=65129 RepID=A0A8S1LHW2_9CILI|nr:unnamed protein product [Paramecium sonneborni]